MPKSCDQNKVASRVRGQDIQLNSKHRAPALQRSTLVCWEMDKVRDTALVHSFAQSVPFVDFRQKAAGGLSAPIQDHKNLESGGPGSPSNSPF